MSDTDDNKPKEWDIAGAKQILSDYKLPSENIDIGNVYYAATQLEAALTEAEASIKRLCELNEGLRKEWTEDQDAIDEAEREIEKMRKVNDEDAHAIHLLTKENADLKSMSTLKSVTDECLRLTKQNEEQAKEIVKLKEQLAEEYDRSGRIESKREIRFNEIIAVIEGALEKILGKNEYVISKEPHKAIADDALARLSEWRGK